uniref:Uncharacterized protein n=1 Tax=Rhizophora mucronata TaxID=61149 RepID=A0A2P2PPF9_RHIMU
MYYVMVRVLYYVGTRLLANYLSLSTDYSLQTLRYNFKHL